MTREQDDRLGELVDKTSAIPYYVQVADVLRERIRQGVWRLQDQLPGEMELCEAFGVSRPVVRQALRQLIGEGLLASRKGKGTFVAAPKIREGLLQNLTGFHQDMAEQGYAARSQVIKQARIPARGVIAERLDVVPGAPMMEIERLRFDVQLIRVRDDEPSPDPRQVNASSLPRSNRLVRLEEGCAPQ